MATFYVVPDGTFDAGISTNTANITDFYSGGGSSRSPPIDSLSIDDYGGQFGGPNTGDFTYWTLNTSPTVNSDMFVGVTIENVDGYTELDWLSVPTAGTTVTCRLRWRPQGPFTFNDTHFVRAYIMDSTGTVEYTSLGPSVSWPGTPTATWATETDTTSITAAGAAASISDWTNARIYLLFFYNRSMSADGLQLQIADVDFEFDVAVQVSTFPSVGSVTTAGQVPDVLVEETSVPTGTLAFSGVAPNPLGVELPGAGAINFAGAVGASFAGPKITPPQGTLSTIGFAPTFVSNPIGIFEYPLSNFAINGNSKPAEHFTRSYGILPQYDRADGDYFFGFVVGHQDVPAGTGGPESIAQAVSGTILGNMNTGGSAPVSPTSYWGYDDVANTLENRQIDAYFMSQGGANLDPYFVIATTDRDEGGSLSGNVRHYILYTSITPSPSYDIPLSLTDLGSVSELATEVNPIPVSDIWPAQATPPYMQSASLGIRFTVDTTDSRPSYELWNGSTWGSSVQFGAEPWGGGDVNWTGEVHGWYRADQSDLDRVGVIWGRTGASSNLGIYITFIDINAGTPIISNTITVSATAQGGYSDDDIWFLGPNTGDFCIFLASSVNQRPDDTTFRFGFSKMAGMDPCFPITIDSVEYYIFRCLDASGDPSFLKIALNPSNWELPTTSIYPSGMETPTDALGLALGDVNAPRSTVTGFSIVWNPISGDAYAAYHQVSTLYDSAGTSSNPYHTDYFQSWRYRDVMDENVSTFSDWILLSTTEKDELPLAPQRAWEWDPFLTLNTGGHGVLSATEPGPLVLWGSISPRDIGNNSDSAVFTIRWYEQGSDPFDVEQPVTVDASASVTGDIIQHQQNPTVTVDIGDSVQLTDQIAKFVTIEDRYLFLEETSLVDVPVTVEIGDQVSVTIDWDSIVLPITVEIDDSVDLTDDLLSIATVYFDTNYMHVGLDWTNDLIDLINGTRSSAGLQPIAEITSTFLGWQDFPRGTQQIHADDMAENDLFNFDGVGVFTSGLETESERVNRIGDYASTTSQIDRRTIADYTDSNSDTVPGDFVINDLSFPTALEWWLSGPNTAYQSFWEFEHDPANTDLAFQLGWAVAPSASFPAESNVLWISMRITDYTGGGPGGGGVAETPATNQRTWESWYPFSGISWHEEFLGYVNDLRATVGLAPWLLPDADFWLGRRDTGDIAQLHNINMADTEVIAHESTDFPNGFQTVYDRQVYGGYPGTPGAENLLYYQQEYFAEPLISANQSRYVITEEMFITPYEAYLNWYNSPGHRANMLTNTSAWESPTSQLSFYWRRYDTPVLIDDQYNGVQYAVDGYFTFVTNNFISAEAIVATRYFDPTYDINGALIELVSGTWDLLAYVDVKAEHTALYTISVAQAHTASYGGRTAAEHEAPIFYGLSADHQASYTQTEGVREDHDSSYRIFDTVPVAQDHESPFGLRLSAAHTNLYDSSLKVSSNHASPWSLMTTVSQDHSGEYAFTVSVAQDHSGDYALRLLNLVTSANQAFYTLIGSALVESPTTAFLTKGSQTIDLLEATVSQDIGDPTWVSRVRLANLEDFQDLVELDPVTLTLGGDTWSLIVTDKSLTRSQVNSPDMRVTLESNFVTKMSPRAAPSSYSNESAIFAKDFAESILGDSITWNVLDWQIPAGIFASESSTPFEALQGLLEVVGAILTVQPDGTFEVNYEAPFRMDKLSTYAVNFTLTDIEDNLSASTRPVFRSGVNSVRVIQGTSIFSDRMEYEKGSSETEGTLKVFPSPFRTNFTVRSTDSASSTSLTLIGTTTTTIEEERVAFQEGSAGLSKPISALTSITWLSDSLGAVSFDQHSVNLIANTAVNEGYGLALVTYESQSVDFSVSGPFGSVDQIILELEE